ncbi:MAG: hypothetical protein Q8O89_03535 [Nanoarchaeota archaeon]|nr:hypothetical protein [Nanoarchaeota archaeon]
MAEEEDYLYLPKSKISDMERELDILRRAKSGQGISNDQLMLSVEKLGKSIEQMMKVFKLATDEIKLEEHDEDTVSKRLEPIIQKLNELTEQNGKIADGVVAVADMVKEHMDREMNEFKSVETKIGQLKMPPMQPAPKPQDSGANQFSPFPQPGQMPPPMQPMPGMMPQGMGQRPGPMPPPPMDFGMDMNFGGNDFMNSPEFKDFNMPMDQMQMPPGQAPPKEKKKGLFGFGK